MTGSKRSTYPWAFKARFRRSAFGWRGDRLAIGRIQEALSEINTVARHDPATAADGAVLFLEKLSPALCQVDGSSGALGQAARDAVDLLAPLIAQAPVDEAQRRRWLDRLYQAIQEDDPPYIETLGDYWGDLCATEALASAWADHLLPTLRSVLEAKRKGSYAFFSGTSLCYSALFKAGRHDEILTLLAQDGKTIWPYRVWGGRVLASRGQIDEAIDYVTDHSGITRNDYQVAWFAEDLLLNAGRRQEAFERYALLANQAHTHLATYRALAKKYPEIPASDLLDRLVASTPATPGKWFATAKTLKLYAEATRLAWASPCDPKTLLRAARDNIVKQPAFAMESALAALHWMAQGHGYELTTSEPVQALQLANEAAAACQQPQRVQAVIEEVMNKPGRAAKWVHEALEWSMQRTTSTHPSP